MMEGTCPICSCDWLIDDRKRLRMHTAWKGMQHTA